MTSGGKIKNISPPGATTERAAPTITNRSQYAVRIVDVETREAIQRSAASDPSRADAATAIEVNSG
jgi:ribosomal protein S30